MATLVPARRNRSLISEIMSDPFDSFFDTGSTAHKLVPTLMRTDILETDTGFTLTIDLPGFKKEDVTVELKDGYLGVAAHTSSQDVEGDEAGTYVRKERFSGTCSRTFYVGEDIEEDEIGAKFADGVLTIVVPKKIEQPKVDEKRTIAIEG